MESVPGRIPEMLLNDQVGLLRADQRVFEVMVDRWCAQLLARGLSTAYIRSSGRVVERFQAHTNEYPWRWHPAHLEDYLSDRRTAEKPVTVATLRMQAGAIRAFCGYLCEPAYGWVPFCEKLFNNVPSQIVFDWNSPRHTTDDARPPGRRSLTIDEMQILFDAADDIVDQEFAGGSKSWLPALRDSIAIKVGYAYGLRRRELTMLEYVDFGPNPHVPDYGNFGAVQVRWAKGTKGSGPRRRTVLTVPQFDWVVGLIDAWLSPEGRELFSTADRSSAMWPSERSGSVVVRTLDRSFKRARERAGLPEELTLHALRHSYVTHLIEAGYDPLFVQQQVGHTYSSTTALYTSVSADFKQKTVQRMIAKRLVSTKGHHDV